MRKYININYSLLAKLLLTGASLAVFLGFYHIQTMSALSCNSLECFFLLSYGNVGITEIKYLFPLFFWILPQVILFYFLGSELASDLERNAVYIFTRTHQRKEWFLAKSLTLSLYVLLYFSVQFLVLWMIAEVRGIHPADLQKGTLIILSEISLLVLLNVMILSMLNLLTLTTNHITAYTVVFASNIASLFFSTFLYESNWGIDIIQWLPFTQGILSWHQDIPASINPMIVQDLPIPQFTILFSLLYLVALTTLFMFLGTQRLEKMDLL
ncbi:hypothetical protein ACFQ49_07950 [Kroppenstedtia eburnea]|uniref:hypothetical protein n=1 Tax=Kroppenstedtia eburnea TaxID=714067 RepID=UPI00362E8CC2